jgi:Cytochrome domain of cellobiose dehydrogenase
MLLPLKIFLQYVLAATLLLSVPVSAEPVQYCKFGYNAREERSEVDFCMGLLMHQNLSTNTHDLYLTMTLTRSSPLGWTAIGAGNVMKGSLMFIVYGDPNSSESPIVSIRTSEGHHQPKLISKADAGGADIRVLRADWVPSTEGFTPSNPLYVAKISLVCYSCHLWPGTEISATSRSQPWIWAWNSRQDIPVYSYDAHLDMHKHHAGNGGWGNFYVDMARSINTAKSAPSLPPIRPQTATLGASDLPLDREGMLNWIISEPKVRAHGFIMTVVFLALFPLGTFAMRSRSAKSFKYHWVIQLTASILAVIGIFNGLLIDPVIWTVHQAVGITLVVALGAQGILGWRHHVGFVKDRRRTWISHAHVWLGRSIIVAGWSNIVTGMRLGGYSHTAVMAVAGLMVLEFVGLTFWICAANRKSRRKMSQNARAINPGWNKELQYFAVGDMDSDDETPEDGSNVSGDPPRKASEA